MSDPVQRLAELGLRGPANRSSAGGTAGQESPFGSAGEQGSARARILDVARDLFCTRGYERTPLRAVSDSLGVTKAAIYYHFNAKDDLLVAIVGPFLDRIDALIDSAGDGFHSPGEQRAFLGRYLDELIGHGGIVALLRDPGVAEHRLGGRFAGQQARNAGPPRCRSGPRRCHPDDDRAARPRTGRRRVQRCPPGSGP